MPTDRCSNPLAGGPIRAVLATAVLALAPCAPLAAAGEYMVQDLGQRVLLPPLYFAALQHVSVAGVDFSYFDDGVHGLELWRSDGTALGTYLVRDACPGVCGSEGFQSSQVLAAVGSQIFFAANDGVHGTELWVSDGTAGGSRQLADLRPGPSSSDPDVLIPAGGLLYFVADDGLHGRDLWRSDGTEAGTFRLFASEPNALVPGVLAIAPGAGQLYLETGGGALWRTDGTAAGTRLLVDSGVYFVRGWMKGAPFRTLPDGVLLFEACDYAASGCELWRSDGTVAGTGLVVDLFPGSGGSFPGAFYVVGAEIWFTAQVPTATGSRFALLRTDGTTGGTAEIPLPPGVEPQTFAGLAEAIGSRFFFGGRDADHGTEPWVTDGVTSEMVADLRPGPESSLLQNPDYDRPWLAELGGDLLFLADDGTNGWRLWRSDGTAPGTEPLSDFGGLPPDAYFGFYQPLAELPTAGGRLLFPIWRFDTGVELWASDGSVAGTHQIGVVSQQTSAFSHASATFWSNYSDLQCLSPLRQGVVFAAFDGAAALTADLLFADGVPGNALPLAPIWDPLSTLPPHCVANADEALVAGGLGGTVSLFRTHGALPGLELLRDFPENTGPITRPLFHRFDGAVFLGFGTSLLRLDPDSQILEQFTALQWGSMASTSTILFLGGTDLEVTDGLEPPAVLLPDPPDPDWIQADDLTVSGDRLFFSLDSPAEGPELWASDGTAEGTGPVTVLRPGPAGGLSRRETVDYWGNRVPESRIAALAAGHVVFAGDDGAAGNELWASDGTAAGTVLVADLAPGPAGSWPRHLTPLGDGVVLFAAEDPALGLELFRTDGTAAGTWMVSDIVAGASSSVPDDFSVQDGVLYFSAWTPADGRELWRSDGTFAGTWRLTEIAPGPFSSSPSKITRAGNRLFFLANDSVHGFELWARADDGSIPLFIDGFETADTARWSATVP